MINRQDDPRKGMKVPDGFFDQIENEIMEHVTEIKVVPFWSVNVNKVIAVAAAVVLMIAALFVLTIQNAESNPTFAELSEEQNWNYLLENSDELTYEEIAEFEESAAAIESLEEELYGNLSSEEILEEIDLETIQNLYK